MDVPHILSIYKKELITRQILHYGAQRFLQRHSINGYGNSGGALLKAANMFGLQHSVDPMPLMGNRFVTLCIIIRTSLREGSRDVKLINRDESFARTLEVVRNMRDAFAKNNPNGRLHNRWLLQFFSRGTGLPSPMDPV